jgi:hypothetical protein
MLNENILKPHQRCNENVPKTLPLPKVNFVGNPVIAKMSTTGNLPGLGEKCTGNAARAARNYSGNTANAAIKIYWKHCHC